MRGALAASITDPSSGRYRLPQSTVHEFMAAARLGSTAEAIALLQGHTSQRCDSAIRLPAPMKNPPVALLSRRAPREVRTTRRMWRPPIA